VARGTLKEPIVPNVATSELAEATIVGLLCDDGDADCHDARHQPSDCELAGQLCMLFQVRSKVGSAHCCSLKVFSVN
jgi:hypothetical protein